MAQIHTYIHTKFTCLTVFAVSSMRTYIHTYIHTHKYIQNSPACPSSEHHLCLSESSILRQKKRNVTCWCMHVCMHASSVSYRKPNTEAKEKLSYVNVCMYVCMYVCMHHLCLSGSSILRQKREIVI